MTDNEEARELWGAICAATHDPDDDLLLDADLHAVPLILAALRAVRAEQSVELARLREALTKIRDLRSGHALGGCDTPEELIEAYARIASTAWETAASALAVPAPAEREPGT